MISPTMLRVGDTVYRCKGRKEKGTIIEVVPYHYVYRKFRVRWASGKVELRFAREFRKTPVGSQPGDRYLKKMSKT